MIYQYDKAIENKFKKVFDRVVYAPTDKFYERYLLSENNKDNVKLPALSIWRTSHEFYPNNARTQLNVSNMRIPNMDTYMSRHIYSMQIKLNYQLDIWAGSDIDRDDMLSEILFFLVTYPNIYIEYEGQNFAFPIQIEPPDDVTDISEFDSNGDLYRISIPLIIPDARLMFYKDAKMCKHIDLTYYSNEEEVAHTEI